MGKTRHEQNLELSLIRRHKRPPRAEVPDELRRRVLIIVDDRLSGRHLARMLTATGYEGVRAVSRAARALVLARQFGPSIVFLDVDLPDDAYELARALRHQAGSDSLRIIALTNSIENSTREQARGAGFERWLVTPVAQSELDVVMGKREKVPQSRTEAPPGAV
jgi:DNA-binding response OmpR family regulator